MQPPIAEKFVAYGGPGEAFSVNLVGRLVALEPSTTMYVVPDPEFDHLAIEGNRRRPSLPNEPGKDFYENNIVAGGGGDKPIIKCETYAVGGRPDGDGGAGHPPSVEDSGVVRQVAVGDRIELSGLYVIDYAHQMYADLHTDSYTYMRGLYKAAFVHAEIHPYNWNSIRLAPPWRAQVGSQRRSACSPMAPQVYSWTYGYNKLTGVAGHFIDAVIERTRQVDHVVYCGVPPSPEYEPHVDIVDVEQVGSGRLDHVTVAPISSTEARATVVIEGADFFNPFVYDARFVPSWRQKVPDLRVEVPDVVGDTPTMAAAELRSIGLNPQFGPGGGSHPRVVNQDPDAGVKVNPGSTVRMSLKNQPDPP